ncbi:hypothetical protein AOLI_G00322930 [Acnodon oligacanthus]
MDARSQSVAIGIAIAFCILGVFLLVCVLQICWKKLESRCKKKRKGPSAKDKILKKLGVKKSSPPFSISGIIDKK